MLLAIRLASSSVSPLALSAVAYCLCLIRERSQVDTPPLYVSSTENVPEGAIVIERVFVDPPERPEAPLLVAEEPSGKDVFGGQEKRRWLIDYPRVGIA
jgi:hypothetical protein